MIAWLAGLAMLFGALAPTLSHAFVPASAQSIEFPICSAVGHTLTDVKNSTIDLGPNPFKHCPYCADQHHAPYLLPSTPAALVAIGGAVLPSLFYQAPEPLFHWAATRSRGPPVLS